MSEVTGELGIPSGYDAKSWGSDQCTAIKRYKREIQERRERHWQEIQSAFDEYQKGGISLDLQITHRAFMRLRKKPMISGSLQERATQDGQRREYHVLIDPQTTIKAVQQEISKRKAQAELGLKIRPETIEPTNEGSPRLVTVSGSFVPPTGVDTQETLKKEGLEGKPRLNADIASPNEGLLGTYYKRSVELVPITGVAHDTYNFDNRAILYDKSVLGVTVVKQEVKNN